MGTVSSDPAKKNVLLTLLERKETLVLRGLNEHPALKSYAVYQMPWLQFSIAKRRAVLISSRLIFFIFWGRKEKPQTLPLQTKITQRK